MNLKRMSYSLIASALFFGCTPENATVHVEPSRQETFERNFRFFPSENTAKQAQYNENTISASFNAFKDAKSVAGLIENQLLVTENGVSVNPFNMTSESERINQVVDIVFLVDITGTMVELIESAKTRLSEFVKSSRERGYHTRMCIATFGDYTVKKCSRFFDNNPRDKKTEAQVKELLSELARLHAYRGVGKDPGWPDLDENPMGALVEAAQAPWGADSQRFVILITDWGFLYSPGNQGTIGDKAPTMKQVTAAIQASQMKVFAVTRTEHDYKGKHLVWDGFNTPFQGEPSIVQSSNGEHFDFDKVLKGEISLTSILERILDRIKTTYKISYIAEKIPGLDASLPLNKRKIEVKLREQAMGEIQMAGVSSSLPTGRPQYQKQWKISDEKIRPESVKVFLNERELSASEASVNGEAVTLTEVPKPGSELRFSFLYQSIDRNLRLETMSFPGTVERDNTTVYLNDKEAEAKDIVFTRDLEGNTILSLADSIVGANDPYEIQRNKGLKIRLVARKKADGK